MRSSASTHRGFSCSRTTFELILFASLGLPTPEVQRSCSCTLFQVGSWVFRLSYCFSCANLSTPFPFSSSFISDRRIAILLGVIIWHFYFRLVLSSSSPVPRSTFLQTKHKIQQQLHVPQEDRAALLWNGPSSISVLDLAFTLPV